MLTNIKRQFASELQTIARNLRNQQKSMFDKLKAIDHGDANFLQLSAQKMLEMKDSDNEAAFF